MSDDTKRRQAEIGAAIDMAAGELPDWWYITLHVESGSASVALTDPDDEDREDAISPCDELAEQITECVKFAKEHN